MSSRSAPTATTLAPYAGSPPASSRAWRLARAGDEDDHAQRALGHGGSLGRLVLVRQADAPRAGEVTLVLAMTPSFYGPAPTLPPTDLTAYADYVRAVMTRYRDLNGAAGHRGVRGVERGQRPDVLDRYARPSSPS